METYSAAIIGAGPAGCAAAIALTRTGHKVILLEAAPFPRHRPGESLHPGVEPIFKTLGIAEAISTAGFLRYPGHRVKWQTHAQACSGKPATERLENFGDSDKNRAEGNWLGYQAWRPTLDKILLDEAIAQGVTLWQPCRVQSALVEDNRIKSLITERGTVHANYFLDASGASRWLSRQLGIAATHHSPKLRSRYGYVTCSPGPNPFDSPLIRSESDGWSWIARVRENLCAWSRMRIGSVHSESDWRPAELTGCAAIGTTKGVDVTWRLSDCLSGSNWFLLGDAAASLDPAASHGVLRSLMSGMQAANIIDAHAHNSITTELATCAYSEWLSDWFYSDVQRMRKLYHFEEFWEFRPCMRASPVGNVA